MKYILILLLTVISANSFSQSTRIIDGIHDSAWQLKKISCDTPINIWKMTRPLPAADITLGQGRGFSYGPFPGYLQDSIHFFPIIDTDQAISDRYFDTRGLFSYHIKVVNMFNLCYEVRYTADNWKTYVTFDQILEMPIPDRPVIKMEILFRSASSAVSFAQKFNSFDDCKYYTYLIDKEYDELLITNSYHNPVEHLDKEYDFSVKEINIK